MRGDGGRIPGDVGAGPALEPPHYLGIDLALDRRSHAARLAEGPGVDDLRGRLPLPRPVEYELRLVGDAVRGLPVDHRLVHPSPVEVGANRRLELVDVGMHLLIGSGPVSRTA